jgi:integrase/recombinase XerD
MAVPAATGSDFVLVNLFCAPVAAPMRLDAVTELIAAAPAGPGSTRWCECIKLRHASGSNVVDAGSGIDVAASLPSHSRVSSQVYAQPGPARREVVDRVPSPATARW